MSLSKIQKALICLAAVLGALAMLSGCGSSDLESGYYTLDSIEEDGTKADGKKLKTYGLDEAYIVVDDDSDGYAVLFGIPVDFSCDSKKEVLDFDGVGKVNYKVSGKKLTLADKNVTMVFEKSKEDEPKKPDDMDLVSYSIKGGSSGSSSGKDSDSGSDEDDSDDSDDSKDSKASGDDASFDFYNGDWFGWWMIDAHADDYTPYHGKKFDVLCRIDMNDDGKTGTIRMWDFGEYSYDHPFAEVEISLTDGTDDNIKAIKSKSGYFSDDKISKGDWTADPGLYTQYSDYILLYDNFTDSSGTDAYDYYIHLKKWGADWEDFGGYPNRYDWYKDLVDKGESMPDTLPEDY